MRQIKQPLVLGTNLENQPLVWHEQTILCLGQILVEPRAQHQQDHFLSTVTASTNHHQLAAMAASYTLHVTLLAQTHDCTVDSHSPSRFVDSSFLQT